MASLTLEKLLSLPKSIYVSMRLFPFKEAVKIPVLCRYNVKNLSLKGEIMLEEGPVKTSMFQIGFGTVGIFDKKYSRTILQIDGVIHLIGAGKYVLGHGSRLCVGRNANLFIGSGFVNTAEMTLVCMQKINIGHHVTTSWNTLLMDTDFHATIDTITGKTNPYTSSI